MKGFSSRLINLSLFLIIFSFLFSGYSESYGYSNNYELVAQNNQTPKSKNNNKKNKTNSNKNIKKKTNNKKTNTKNNNKKTTSKNKPNVNKTKVKKTSNKNSNTQKSNVKNANVKKKPTSKKVAKQKSNTKKVNNKNINKNKKTQKNNINKKVSSKNVKNKPTKNNKKINKKTVNKKNVNSKNTKEKNKSNVNKKKPNLVIPAAIAVGGAAAVLSSDKSIDNDTVSGLNLISPNNSEPKFIKDEKLKKNEIKNMNDLFPTSEELKGGIEKWITSDAIAVDDNTCEVFEKSYFYYSLEKEKIMDIERNNTYFVNSRMFQCNNTSIAYDLYKDFYNVSREKVNRKYFITIPFGNDSFVVMLPLTDDKGKRIKSQHANYYITFIMRNFVLQIHSDDGFAVMEVASKLEKKLNEFLKEHNTNILANKINLTINYNGETFSDNVSFTGNNVDKVRLRGNIYDKDGKRLSNAIISSLETGQNTLTNDYGEYLLDVGYDNGTSITIHKDIYIPYVEEIVERNDFSDGKYYFNLIGKDYNSLFLGLIDFTLNEKDVYGRLINLDNETEYFLQGEMKYYLIDSKAKKKKDRKKEISYKEAIKNIESGKYIYKYDYKKNMELYKTSMKEKSKKNRKTEISDEMLEQENLYDYIQLDKKIIEDFSTYENESGEVMRIDDLYQKGQIQREIELELKLPINSKGKSKEYFIKFKGEFENESEIDGTFVSNNKDFEKGLFNINKHNFKKIRERSLLVDKGIKLKNAKFNKKKNKIIVNEKSGNYILVASSKEDERRYININLFDFNRADINFFEKSRIFLDVKKSNITDNAYIAIYKKNLDFYGFDVLEKTIFKQSVPRHLNKKYILDITDIIKYIKSNDIYIELVGNTGDYVVFSTDDVETEFEYYRDIDSYAASKIITAKVMSLNSLDLVANSSRIMSDGKSDFTIGLNILGKGRVIENIEVEGVASIKRKWNTFLDDIYPAIAVTDETGKILNNKDSSVNIKLKEQENNFILYLYKGSLTKGNLEKLNMKITISGKEYVVPVNID